MKNSFKILVVALLLGSLAGVGLVACNSGTTQETAPTYLSAPIPVLFENTLSWNGIAHSTGYDIYVNGKFYVNVTDCFYVLSLDEGSYEIRIVAKGDGKTYADSPMSVAVTYVSSTTASRTVQSVIESGVWEYAGVLNDAIEFIENHQVKDPEWWRLLENIFVEHRDNDGGYSAEFWGKLLRGGVLTYKYTRDEATYDQLETTVRNVLAIQANEPDGRLSGFDVEHEFTGWDLRSRSYNLLGMEYFYEICKDEQLKADILNSLCMQLDYIMKYVGEGEGKTDILQTSPDWGGCTSANMLEGVVRLYMLTDKEEYRAYAKYIIDTGGSTMLSDEGRTIVQDALAGTPMYQWGCRKFYEIANFMEGILQYYLATGDEQAKEIALGFYNVVDATEVTEAGGVAVDVEEACNSKVEQCDPDNTGRMQETCAVVVWMKFCLHLYQITGDAGMMDNIEKTYYNFMLGIVDWELHNGWPVFSYSPLACTARQDVYSGTAFLDDTNVQSCCVISGVSGLPTVVEAGITRMQGGFSFNLYIPGTVTTTTENGNVVSFECDTEYPAQGNIAYTVNIDSPEKMNFRFRVPAWSKQSSIAVNGENVVTANEGGYYTVEREWKNGDVIEIVFDMSAYLIQGSEECSNPYGVYNVVVKRGPIVYTRDYRLEGDAMFSPLTFDVNRDGTLNVEVEQGDFLSQCQLSVGLADGTSVSLVDYGSAGKTMDDNSIMCLWIPTVDYWSVDLGGDVVLRAGRDGALMRFVDDGHLVALPSYGGVTDKGILAAFAWQFEKEGDYYRIKCLETGGYLTVRDDDRITYVNVKYDSRQLFSLKQCGLNKFKLVLRDGRVLSRYQDDDVIYMTDDISHENQYWYFEAI